MFLGEEGIAEQGEPLWGMGGDIDNLDVIAFEDFAVVGVDVGVGVELIASSLCALEDEVAEGDDFVPGGLVGFEMPLGDSAAGDEADIGGVLLGIAGLIGQIGGGDGLEEVLFLEIAVFIFFSHGFSCGGGDGNLACVIPEGGASWRVASAVGTFEGRSAT